MRPNNFLLRRATVAVTVLGAAAALVSCGSTEPRSVLDDIEGGEVILGIGVNLAHAPEVPGRSTASLKGAAIPADFCARLAECFAARRAQWRTGGFAAIREDWLARAHPPGTLLRVRAGGEERGGSFDGLAEDGALLLRLGDGTVQRVLAGDVWED